MLAPDPDLGNLPRPRKGLRRQIPLPLWVQVLLHVTGWALVVLGVIGLFLPILQGMLFLLAGFALLSIASQAMHGFLRQQFRRWPRGWRQLERARRAISKRLPRTANTTPQIPPSDTA